MSESTDGEGQCLAVCFQRLILAVAVVALLLVAPSSSQGSNDSKDEAFEAVDPYTCGDRAGIDRAGYVGLGPFPWWDGVRTTDVEEVIGRRVLWVETAHFKIGSTLETYKTGKADLREAKRLKEELKRLEPKLTKFKPAAGKVDAWLRLHLYAQRIEEQYAGFSRTFSLTAADFSGENDVVPDDAPRGRGPYLGQARKSVVLLVEKQSHFGRIAARWFEPVPHQSTRQRLPGGGMLLLTCAELFAKSGYEQDGALHCLIASDLTFNFVDGFRDRGYWAPLWFKTGLAHIAARSVDEKLAIYAFPAARQHDTDAWKWEPRVLGLVTNDYVPKWSQMMEYTSWDQLTGPAHMCSWSRASWMLGQGDEQRKAWLIGIARPYHDLKADERARATQENERQIMLEIYAKTPEQMDAAWRSWVTETYKR